MRILRFVEDWTVVLSFLAIVVITFVNVLSRFVFRASLSFTEELTINLLVVLTMSGAVVALRTGTHLGFDLLLEKSRGKLHTVMVLASGLVVVLFLLVLLVFGGEMLLAQAERGRATPSLGIPQWLFTMAIPLTGLFGIIHAVEAVVTSLRGAGSRQDTHVPAEVPGALADEDPLTVGGTGPAGGSTTSTGGSTGSDGGTSRKGGEGK